MSAYFVYDSWDQLRGYGIPQEEALALWDRLNQDGRGFIHPAIEAQDSPEHQDRTAQAQAAILQLVRRM